MASTFGSTNIRVEIDPATGAAPTWERQSYVTTRHVPGGNTDVTQVTGYGSQTVALRLLLNGTEWSALQGQLQATATLTLAGVSQGSALLESLAQPARLIDGWVNVTATFRKV